VQDTRLTQAIAELADAKALLAEILDESPRDPHDVVALVAAQKFLFAALKQIRAAVTVCGDFNTVGSMCVKPAGHGGGHRSVYGAQWTAESNAAAGQWMSKQMTGRD
jgi:hypothetical protein